MLQNAYLASEASLAEWVVAITTTIGSFAAAVVSIIVAVKTKDIQREVKTSDGTTLGEKVEATQQAVTEMGTAE